MSLRNMPLTTGLTDAFTVPLSTSTCETPVVMSTRSRSPLSTFRQLVDTTPPSVVIRIGTDLCAAWASQVTCAKPHMADRRSETGAFDRVSIGNASLDGGRSNGWKKYDFCLSKFYFVFTKNVLYSARPAPTRGRFAVVTDVGCGMRWALGIAAWFAVPTNDPERTVKSRGPGLPVLRSSLRALLMSCLRVMGARQPVPREIAYKS